MEIKQFKYQNFECDVRLYRDGDDVVARFYDKSKDHDEKDIGQYYIVDHGFGFLSFLAKEDEGLVSGILDMDIFSSDEMTHEAIEFLLSFTEYDDARVLWHIEMFKKHTKFYEHNGEE